MTTKACLGFKSEPFAKDIATTDLLKLPSMVGVKEHFDHCLSLGGVMVLLGEVGSGKTTSMRWTLSHYHPSELKQVNVVANTSSMLEFYR